MVNDHFSRFSPSSCPKNSSGPCACRYTTGAPSQTERHSDRRRGLSLRGRLGLGQVEASRRLLPLLIPPRWVDFNAAAHKTGGKVKGDRSTSSPTSAAHGPSLDRCGRDRSTVPARGDDRLGPCAHLPQRPPHRDASCRYSGSAESSTAWATSSASTPSSNETPSTSRPSSPAFRSPTTTSGVSSWIWAMPRCLDLFPPYETAFTALLGIRGALRSSSFTRRSPRRTLATSTNF